MRTLLLRLLFFIFISLPHPVGAEAYDTIKIYLDVDFSNASSSSIAIERGILTALDEVENKIGESPVVVVRKNHHGNARRSKDNLKEYLTDPQGLAVFAGLHSPPLLANLEFINKNQVLVLDPWAAAGPITRYPAKENWIFRLSVDDSKAGFTIVQHAVEQRGMKRPALLLEETGWGKSNEKTMGRALRDRGLAPTGIFWFNWGLRERGARIILRSIIDSQPDSILLVANAPEAKVICKALLSLEQPVKLPVFSHWGLTGGDFPEVIKHAQRQQIDLSFLQTNFSFISNKESQYGQQVLARAKKIFPQDIQSAGDIRAPAGFIHAYDLTRIFLAAAQQGRLSGNIRKDRQMMRKNLESLEKSVQGLIKNYSHPFAPFRDEEPDNHEALGAEDLTMGRYNKENQIELLKPR